jgi:cytochrome P450
MLFNNFILDLAERARRLPAQIQGQYPFDGNIRPTRIPLYSAHSASRPFPHPWNYQTPIDILASYFTNAEHEEGHGRHTRYLDIPGLPPFLVTRDPSLIRAITAETGEKPGQFDRDPLFSVGIARATGLETLLSTNGKTWKKQKRLSTPPFSRAALFQPEQFEQFAATFRRMAAQRIDTLLRHVGDSPHPIQIQLEPEIKAVMLEMLTNNFFGAQIPAPKIRYHYVPALERVVDHIIRDTIVNPLAIPLGKIPTWSQKIADTKAAYAAFDDLTTLVLAGRKEGKGLWSQFQSDACDQALRGNIKVFLGGALEATTSYAGWAISHLARNPDIQEKVYQEVKDITHYTPHALAGATWLGHVLNETLRLTPPIYLLPRQAAADTWVETQSGDRLMIPKGTHIVLDVWHANRHEDHWGVAATGFPATDFAPQRWENIKAKDKSGNEFLHFGFGHGPRFCPGKQLGQLEVALVVGAFVKLFSFRAVHPENPVKAGIATKPQDGVLVELQLRSPAPISPVAPPSPQKPSPSDGAKCPFHHPS